MTTWASEMTQYRDSNGDVMQGVRRYVFDAVTDVDGQFTVDLSALSLTAVLEVSSYTVGQTLTAATDVTTILTARAVEVTTTTVKGVLINGNSLTISVGILLKTLQRGGSGVSVKVIVTAL